MRGKILIALLVIVGVVVSAAAIGHFRIFPFYQLKAVKLYLMPQHDALYYQRLKEFTICKPCDYDIVMLGDSLTAHGDWAALLPFWHIANRGISGDDSRGMLERMDSILNTGATRAFLMLGINDFYEEGETADVLHNYQKIIAYLLRENIQILIQSTLYVGREDARLWPKITLLNRQLKAIALADERITFVDLNAVLSPNGELNPEFTVDGIHLNQAGYAAWSCYLLQAGYLSVPENAESNALPKHCGGDR
ncbi:MAG: GDSL-type esterase/lipase family protein [Mariprofundaceae bacterium]